MCINCDEKLSLHAFHSSPPSSVVPCSFAYSFYITCRTTSMFALSSISVCNLTLINNLLYQLITPPLFFKRQHFGAIAAIILWQTLERTNRTKKKTSINKWREKQIVSDRSVKTTTNTSSHRSYIWMQSQIEAKQFNLIRIFYEQFVMCACPCPHDYR